MFARWEPFTMDEATIETYRPACNYNGLSLKFSFVKERNTELTFIDWPTLEGAVVN